MLGIRTATDLQDAFPLIAGGSRAGAWPDRAAQVRDVLYPGNTDPQAAVDLLLSGFHGEANLRHVRSWREFDRSSTAVVVLPSTPAAVLNQPAVPDPADAG